VSSWDDSGYRIDDPKHEVNAGAGRGLASLWRRKPPPRFTIAFDFPEGGGPFFPVQIGGGAGYTTDLSAAETFGDEAAAEWFLESNYGPMTAQWGVVVEVPQS
jgi:hypothetical protein